MDTLVFDAKTHTYRVEGRIVPHITEIVPSDYSHVHPLVLERARQRGTAVHKATEYFDLTQWARLDALLRETPKVEPYLDGWIKAVNDYEIEFAPEDVER